MQRRRGISLVEVLVVIAIVAILAAVEISNLRQLGQAAALYEQTYGAHPMGVEPLMRGQPSQGPFIAYNRRMRIVSAWSHLARVDSSRGFGPGGRS